MTFYKWIAGVCGQLFQLRVTNTDIKSHLLARLVTTKHSLVFNSSARSH